MRYLNLLLLGVIGAQALPTARTAGSLLSREEADEDDNIVYAWALPEAQKLRREEADEDDNVVYAWALPEEGTNVKREEADEDDNVVYAWALPKAEE